MRVVYVSTDEGVPTFGTKGSSVHVQAMLSQFLDRGDEVHLVTSRPGSPPPTHLSRVRVDRQAAVDVAYAATGQAGLVVCVSEPVADWVRALGSAPPDAVHTVPN